MITPRRLSLSRALPLTLAAAALLVPGLAHANPRSLPFTYPYGTLACGDLEIEQFIDLTPVRVARERPDGTTEGVYSTRYVLQTELEFGLTDRLEGSFYFSFRQGPSADTPFLRFEGIKQRLRYRFAQQNQWPIDVGLYFETAEFHNEVELEEKLLLSKRFGAINAMVNLWVEQEYYFQDDVWKYVYNPTAGVTYEVSPRLTLGLEYWGRGRFDDTSDDGAAGSDSATTGARHYLGPTVMAQSGEYWMSFSPYLRLDHLGDSVPVGESYGRLWVRAVFGMGF